MGDTNVLNKCAFSRRFIMTTAAFLALTGCDAPTVSFNYRLKVVVTVDGVERTGASVIGVRWEDASRELMNYGASMRSEISGEAVVVDLGQSDFLFALLSGPEGGGDQYFAADRSPVRAYDDHSPWRPSSSYFPTWDEIEQMPSRSGEVALLAPDRPMLIYFDDPNTLSALTELDPDTGGEVNGRQVLVKRITVETTTDPITHQVTDEFPIHTTFKLDGITAYHFYRRFRDRH